MYVHVYCDWHMLFLLYLFFSTQKLTGVVAGVPDEEEHDTPPPVSLPPPPPPAADEVETDSMAASSMAESLVEQPAQQSQAAVGDAGPSDSPHSAGGGQRLEDLRYMYAACMHDLLTCKPCYMLDYYCPHIDITM